jgi:predicted RNA-binding Zn ribbon-like protein
MSRPDSQRERPRFELSGGALCLDFANTRGERDSLSGLEDVVRFGEQAGYLTPAEARRARIEAGRAPARAGRAFRRAIDLRERLYRVFAALGAGERAERADIDALNRELAAALARLRLVPSGSGFAWGWAERLAGLDRLLWPVVRSAGELLTSGEAEAVRECGSPTCSWLFVDRSRTGRRRWCDMKTCGNRAKARRHYHRAKRVRAEAEAAEGVKEER